MLASQSPASFTLRDCLSLFDAQSNVRIQFIEPEEDVHSSRYLRLSTRLSSLSTHHISLQVNPDVVFAREAYVAPSLDVVVRARDLQCSVLPEHAPLRLVVEDDHLLHDSRLLLHQQPILGLSSPSASVIIHRLKCSRDVGAPDLEIGIPECRFRLGHVTALMLWRQLQRWPCSALVLSLSPPSYSTPASSPHPSRLYLEGAGSETLWLRASVAIDMVRAPQRPLRETLNAKHLVRILSASQFVGPPSDNGAEAQCFLEAALAPGSAVAIRLHCLPAFSLAAVIAVQLPPD
jgi:hypothetical protein